MAIDMIINEPLSMHLEGSSILFFIYPVLNTLRYCIVCVWNATQADHCNWNGFSVAVTLDYTSTTALF